MSFIPSAQTQNLVVLGYNPQSVSHLQCLLRPQARDTKSTQGGSAVVPKTSHQPFGLVRIDLFPHLSGTDLPALRKEMDPGPREAQIKLIFVCF